MNKVEASNLLRTNLGASVAELETTYRKRREEVRKRFEEARDRNTRSRCEREYFALEQARDLLLAKKNDLLGGDETPAVKDEELEVNLHTPLVEREEFLVQGEELSLAREKLPLVRKALPAQGAETAVGRRGNVPIKRGLSFRNGAARPIPPVAPRIKRVFGTIEPALSPLQRVARSIASNSSPIKGASKPSANGSSPIADVSPPKPIEPKPNRPTPEQGRTGSNSKGRRVMKEAVFVVVLASVLTFFIFRAADKSKSGTLVVNTVPDGAEVWLDEVLRGKTPLILEDVACGDRRLTIKLPAYRDEEIVVSVKPGDEESTGILQLVPVEQSSPKPTSRPSSTSRLNLVIVPPTASPAFSLPGNSRQ